MKKVGVIANPKRPHAADIFERLAKKAEELGWTLFADPGTATYLPGSTVIEFSDFASTVDVLLSMGGDGTMLLCAQLLNGADVPILGINLGSLGFLTSIAEDSFESALDALETGEIQSETRTVGECTVGGKTHRVLNDIAIGWGGTSRMISLHTSIDGEHITTFSCDGMILTTPTGSTGHSLSCGGPIIQPGTAAFGISVICPHTLSNRPLVIPDSSTIEIRIESAHKTILLAVDGKDVDPLNEGDIIRFSKSDRPVRFLHLPGYSYFSLLRQKLHWRGSTL
jgi:NAD+ kinase